MKRTNQLFDITVLALLIVEVSYHMTIEAGFGWLALRLSDISPNLDGQRRYL